MWSAQEGHGINSICKQKIVRSCLIANNERATFVAFNYDPLNLLLKGNKMRMNWRRVVRGELWCCCNYDHIQCGSAPQTDQLSMVYEFVARWSQMWNVSPTTIQTLRLIPASDPNHTQITIRTQFNLRPLLLYCVIIILCGQMIQKCWNCKRDWLKRPKGRSKGIRLLFHWRNF